MSIKAKTVFTTSDGKVHDNRATANKHEAGWKIRTRLEEAFVKAAPGRMPSEFSVNLLNDPKALAELRDVCNKGLEYHRNYVKK